MRVEYRWSSFYNKKKKKRNEKKRGNIRGECVFFFFSITNNTFFIFNIECKLEEKKKNNSAFVPDSGTRPAPLTARAMY